MSLVYPFNGYTSYSRERKDMGAGTRARYPALPTSDAEWQLEYERRETAYYGHRYEPAEHREFNLFRAFDANDKLLVETQRIATDLKLVIDLDSRLLLGSSPTLAAAANADADTLEAGAAVWRRSRFQQQTGKIAFYGALYGRVGIEAVRTSATAPYQTALVCRDPRHYRAEYDLITGTRLERVVITTPYLDAPTISPTGEVQPDDERTLHSYVRILDRESITVYIDGELVEEESGPHGLGAVPFVNLIFLPTLSDEHGMWAPHGIERALAMFDTCFAQAQAVGANYGDPKVKVKGAEVGDGSDLMSFAKVISGIPVDGDVSYLEPSLAGLRALLDAATTALSQAREAIPEFAFVGAGAGASGEALKMRAADLVAKIEEIRGRWLPQIAEVTAYAAAMDNDAPYDADAAAAGLVVKAAPVMPVDIRGSLEALGLAVNAGLARADQIRELQRLGFIDADADPDTYDLPATLAEATAETTTRRDAGG